MNMFTGRRWKTEVIWIVNETEIIGATNEMTNDISKARPFSRHMGNDEEVMQAAIYEIVNGQNLTNVVSRYI